MVNIDSNSDYEDYASEIIEVKKAIFCIMKPFNGEDSPFRNRSMIAPLCKDKKSVNNFHREGLENGVKDEGAPGFRPGYDGYFSYLRDFDGNKICTYCELSK